MVLLPVNWKKWKQHRQVETDNWTQVKELRARNNWKSQTLYRYDYQKKKVKLQRYSWSIFGWTATLYQPLTHRQGPARRTSTLLGASGTLCLLKISVSVAVQRSRASWHSCQPCCSKNAHPVLFVRFPPEIGQIFNVTAAPLCKLWYFSIHDHWNEFLILSYLILYVWDNYMVIRQIELSHFVYSTWTWRLPEASTAVIVGYETEYCFLLQEINCMTFFISSIYTFYSMTVMTFRMQTLRRFIAPASYAITSIGYIHVRRGWRYP
jgi:hypothetical protein